MPTTIHRVMSRLICEDCANVLTDEERHYYAGRCEVCEIAWSARVELWRRGGEDPDLDRRFAVPVGTSH